MLSASLGKVVLDSIISQIENPLDKLVTRIVPWLLPLLLIQVLPFSPRGSTMMIMCNSNEYFSPQVASIHDVYHISGKKM